MEQVEGGNLIVNKGNESVPKEKPGASGRNMNAVDNKEEAIKLARVCRHHITLSLSVFIRNSL